MIWKFFKKTIDDLSFQWKVLKRKKLNVQNKTNKAPPPLNLK
jgi:hypothetical protein